MPQTLKNTKHSIEEGGLKINEMHGNFPIFDMSHAFRHHKI